MMPCDLHLHPQRDISLYADVFVRGHCAEFFLLFCATVLQLQPYFNDAKWMQTFSLGLFVFV